jgi:RNA polymerase-binding transcription factor DksA
MAKKDQGKRLSNEKWTIKSVDAIKRNSIEWKSFVIFQKQRIEDRLARYNNKQTVTEQIEERGDLTPYQRYKIGVVSNYLNEALELISAGKYGVCKICKEDIPIQRLFLVPGSLCCVSCDKKK